MKHDYVSKKSVKRAGFTEFYALIPKNVVEALALDKKSIKLKTALPHGLSARDKDKFLRSVESEMKAIDRDIAQRMRKPRASSTPQKQHGPTVAGYIREYLKHRNDSKRNGLGQSLKTALERLSSLWEDFNPSLCLSDVDADSINKFADFLSRRYANNTVNYYLRYSLTVFKAANKRNRDDHQDISNSQFQIIKDSISEKRHDDYSIIDYERGELSLDQVVRLIETPAPEGCQKYIDAFKLSLFTGLRYSDIRNITEDAIVGNKLRLRSVKTKKGLTVYLNDDALQIIESNKPDLFSSFDRTTTRINRAIAKWCAAAGVALNTDEMDVRFINEMPAPNITIHTARHTYASTLINDTDTDSSTVKALLGHSDIKVTLRYAKSNDETKMRVNESLPYCSHVDDD